MEDLTRQLSYVGRRRVPGWISSKKNDIIGLLNVCERDGEMALWLRREFTDRKVRGSNPTPASRLPSFRLAQLGTFPAVVLLLGGMAARHRKGVTAE
ncbi:hypothetical protein CSKR_102091 [Clonorchis sinensis]|uniref:Uncharacterized protein n=1 Tax=Clonorchis sinensis TaxID=79923 RepID=A0A3R7CAK3_CLOSI|nr:hypothetical protein CSKR_102091 [Clonorchis sinensis]